MPTLTHPVRRRMYILLFECRFFRCACLCPIGDWNFGILIFWLILVYILCTLLWRGATWWGTCLIKFKCMRTCFPIRGEYVTHMKIQGFHVVLAILCYIGQCDLINTCFRLPQVWYTPGGSMCRICYLTSKESILTITGSH